MSAAGPQSNANFAGIGTLVPSSVQDGERWEEVVAILAEPEVLRPLGFVGARRRIDPHSVCVS